MFNVVNGYWYMRVKLHSTPSNMCCFYFCSLLYDMFCTNQSVIWI